jgi:RNA polymerase sigma factor (sigma-70 family)
VAREDPRSDEALLAATPRDPEAFAAFYRRHLRPLLAYFLRRTGRPDLATDLTSETFAAALESLPRFEAKGGTARGWLFGIASHKLGDAARTRRVSDAARRRLGMAPLAIEDDFERADELIAARELASTLEGLVADLPADQRRAVLARVVEERDYADIAAELECSQALVRKRVSRALASLRRRMGQEVR